MLRGLAEHSGGTKKAFFQATFLDTRAVLQVLAVLVCCARLCNWCGEATLGVADGVCGCGCVSE